MRAYRWVMHSGQAMTKVAMDTGGAAAAPRGCPATISMAASRRMCGCRPRGCVRWTRTGCPPEWYPGALDLVLSGKIRGADFIERRPLVTINETFAEVRDHRLTRRVVLTPTG